MTRSFLVRGALALLAALVLASPAAQAQTVTVKLATLAPDGSPWHLKLKEFAQKWDAASGGKVKVKLYPGGVAGNEGDVIRKMRVGQLQAGAVTIVGLRDIDDAPQAIGTPGLIADDAEWDYVYPRMQPGWEKRLADKGFVVLSWGDAGWVRLFSKKEGRTPQQLAGLKMFTWANDQSAANAWKQAGFQPVVLSITDLLPSLSTGMVEAFANTAVMAMTARWYEQAPKMPDVNWGRLGAATIITKEAWEKVPADLRPQLLQIAKDTGASINVEIAKMGRDALEVMKKNGLQLIQLTDAERAQWQKTAESTWPTLRGGAFPADQFDEVKRLRDEYRASKGKK